MTNYCGRYNVISVIWFSSFLCFRWTAFQARPEKPSSWPNTVMRARDQIYCFAQVFWVNLVQNSHLIQNATCWVPTHRQCNADHKWPHRKHKWSSEILSILQKCDAAGKPSGWGKKGPQTSCNEGFFAHLDGCSPHTEELRRSDSPSVFSIAVTICGGQKTESLTFCQGKEKELVTLAPTLFTPKNAKQGRKLFRCSDLSTGGKPARPALHRQSWAELQDSSPGPEECHKNNMT